MPREEPSLHFLVMSFPPCPPPKRRVLTWSPCLAHLLTALLFVPGSLHRWLHTIYLKDAHPSPTPRHRCQHLASIVQTSCWLEKKWLFRKQFAQQLSPGPVINLCVPWLLLLAVPFQKQVVHGKRSVGTQDAPPFSFHATAARSVKEAFLVLEARDVTVSFLSPLPCHPGTETGEWRAICKQSRWERAERTVLQS